MNKEHQKLLKETSERNIKEIAFNIGCHRNTVVREIDGRAKHSMLDKVIGFMNAEDGDRIIQYLTASQDGFFFRDVKRLGASDFTVIPALLKEFTELMNVLAESLLDGKVTEAEYKKIKKEWADCSAIVQALFAAIERGDYKGQQPTSRTAERQ